MTLSEITPAPCPNGCTHTDAEHLAFDQGWEAVVLGVRRSTCPYLTPALREAWFWGWDYGQWDCETQKLKLTHLRPPHGDASDRLSE